jgi:putative alpha-1,2-mannosidase
MKSHERSDIVECNHIIEGRSRLPILKSSLSSAMVFLALSIASMQGLAQSQDLAEYVNVFIGTGSRGNTYPGAVRPWGSVSVSPHNAPEEPSGYRYGERSFYGFGHVHLSGTGCGDFGSIIVTASRGPLPLSPDELLACSYRDEAASPGYYKVRLLEPALVAEVSATTRCGIIRLTSLEDGPRHILLNAGRSLSWRKGGSVKFVSSKRLEGYNISGGICGENNRHRVYFSAELSEPPAKGGIWKGNEVAEGRSAAVEDSTVGAWVTFNSRKGNALILKVGISFVSTDNARQNLDAEIPGWDFEMVRAESRSVWNEELSRIRVESSSRDDLMKFWAGSGGPRYVEGNAWHYTWFVPHDVRGLVSMFGNTGQFVSKLEQAFTQGLFTLANEPEIGYPYLFACISGTEHKTRMMVRQMMNDEFGTDPSGLPGDDDTGTLSAWFVFSALGFYPMCPASPEYVLGVPLFKHATISFHPDYFPGKQFTIETADDQDSESDVTAIELNGKSLMTSQLLHQDIVSGGKLLFRFSRGE